MTDRQKFIPAIDFDALLARANAKKERLQALAPEGSFPATSLTAWLNIAGLAKVDSIPARQIGSILAGSEEPDAELDAAIRQAEASGEMVRTDVCSGYEVKILMADGGYPKRPAWQWGDPRIFDLIIEDGRAEVPALARPWVDDLMTTTTDGGHVYPVEFRVYFGGDAEDGAVSAYYPQAAPVENDVGMPLAEEARRLASAMVRACVRDGRAPWMLRYGAIEGLDRNRVHCTLDFAVKQDGRLLFLEAGPAYFANWGAHPCCFEGRDGSGNGGCAMLKPADRMSAASTTQLLENQSSSRASIYAWCRILFMRRMYRLSYSRSIKGRRSKSPDHLCSATLPQRRSTRAATHSSVDEIHSVRTDGAERIINGQRQSKTAASVATANSSCNSHKCLSARGRRGGAAMTYESNKNRVARSTAMPTFLASPYPCKTYTYRCPSGHLDRIPLWDNADRRRSFAGVSVGNLLGRFTAQSRALGTPSRSKSSLAPASVTAPSERRPSTISRKYVFCIERILQRCRWSSAISTSSSGNLMFTCGMDMNLGPSFAIDNI